MTAAAVAAAAGGLGLERPARGPALRTTALLGPAILVVAVGLVVPLGLMVRFSFDRFVPGELVVEAFTLENYGRFFADSFYQTVLLRSLGIALASTAIVLVLGLPTAYWMSRIRSRRLKTVAVLLTVVPLLMGNAVRVAGWMVLLADKGVVNAALTSSGLLADPVRILYTGYAVAIGLVAVLLPVMIITLQSVFDGIAETLEEAALSLGASSLVTFRRVLLPLAMPGIFSGSLLCFVLAVNAYATPVLIGGPSFHMMAPKVYEQAIKVFNWPFAASLAFILMAVTLGLTVVASLAVQRRYGRV